MSSTTEDKFIEFILKTTYKARINYGALCGSCFDLDFVIWRIRFMGFIRLFADLYSEIVEQKVPSESCLS